MATKLRVTPIPTTIPIVAAGNIGTTGPQGAMGPPGAQGADGQPGPPGADSVVPGPPGPQGPIGPTGAASTVPGPPGATGPTGPQGLTGPQGPAGADSTVPGPQGPAGPQGLKGDTGAASTVPGPTGPAGAQGPQGVKGDTGATGSQGPIGNTGAQGPQGTPGATGAQGPAGAGVIPGGTTDQVLSKVDATDFNTIWKTVAAGGSGLPTDTVVAAATRIIANKLTAGDAQPSWRVMGDGKMEWGGGSSVPDFNLARTSATTLKHSATLHVADSLVARQGGAGQVTVGTSSSTPTVSWGSGTDATIIRQSSGILRTAGTFDANALTINGVPVGAGAALPADTVVVAATRIIANKILAGDAQPTWRVLGDGKQEWGPGGATAPDTSLNRQGINALGTPGMFYSAVGFSSGIKFLNGTGAPQRGSITLGDATGWRLDFTTDAGARLVSITDGGVLTFGAAGDTNLYRSSLGAYLETTNDLLGKASLQANHGGANRVVVGSNGVAPAASLAFGSALDTNLYRSAADTLKTDDHFHSTQWIIAAQGTAATVAIGPQGPANEAGFRFGSAVDTNLYRSAAGNLKTDGSFQAGSNVYVDIGGVGGKLYFGSAADTSLYRVAGFGYPVLATDGVIQTRGANGHLWIYDTGQLFFGGSADTNLYRAAAGKLRTGGDFQVERSVHLDISGGGYQLFFGTAGDTYMWRSAANVLKTNGAYMATLGVYALNGNQICMYGPTLAHWKMLGGSTIITTDTGGDAYIVYPAAVSSVLTVVACNGDYTFGAGDWNVSVHPTLYTTGFYVSVSNPNGTPYVSASCRINWMALVII